MEKNRLENKYENKDLVIKCSRCKVDKHNINFYKNTTSPNGYSHRCIDCYKETHYEYYRNWYTKKLDIIIQRHKKFKATARGKEVGRLANYRRRMRLKGGKSEKYNQEDILKEFGYRCFNCGTYEKPTFDHIMPIELNGDDMKHNISILCLSCNCSKGGKHPRKFYSEEQIISLEKIKDINIPRI